jgi:hypothetical protein
MVLSAGVSSSPLFMNRVLRAKTMGWVDEIYKFVGLGKTFNKIVTEMARFRGVEVIVRGLWGVSSYSMIGRDSNSRYEVGDNMETPGGTTSSLSEAQLCGGE